MKTTNKINLDLDNALLDNFNLEALDIGELQLKGGNFITDHPGLSAGIGIALFTIAAIADHKFALIDRFRNGNPLYNQLIGEEVVIGGKLYKQVEIGKDEVNATYTIGSVDSATHIIGTKPVLFEKTSGNTYIENRNGHLIPTLTKYPGEFFSIKIPNKQAYGGLLSNGKIVSIQTDKSYRQALQVELCEFKGTRGKNGNFLHSTNRDTETYFMSNKLKGFILEDGSIYHESEGKYVLVHKNVNEMNEETSRVIGQLKSLPFNQKPGDIFIKNGKQYMHKLRGDFLS